MNSIITKILYVVLALPTFLIAQTTTCPKEISLSESYKNGLLVSAQNKINRTQIEILNSNYQEALSAIYPKLNFNADYTNRDNADFGRLRQDNQSSVDVPGSNFGAGVGRIGRDISNSRLSLTQPIFRGFRDYLIKDAIKTEIKATELNNSRFEELFYQDLTELFFQTFYYKLDIENLNKNISVLKKRVNELEQFIKLGKSRDNEKLAALSELADIEASKIRLEMAYDSTRQMFSYLAGYENCPVINLKAEPELTNIQDLNYYQTNASKRKDLAALRLLVDSQNLRLKAAKRERLPSIDLVANAYSWEEPDRNREWDLMLSLSLPIFDAGQISARVSSEQAKLSQSLTEVSAKVRDIDRDIRIAHNNVVKNRELIASLVKLNEIMNKKYLTLKEDYTNGITTNLEVLQAINQKHAAERQLLQAKRDQQVSMHVLKVISGAL